jgi:aminopeptidase
MSLRQYRDFFFGAVHANEDDPIAYWKSTAAGQQRAIDWLAGKGQVVMRGPNVDLTLSIKGRKFMNSTGMYNMPDGEIYTGPVEDRQRRVGYLSRDPGVQSGRNTSTAPEIAKAEKIRISDQMLGSNSGSRYLGEYAIGTNFDVSIHRQHTFRRKDWRDVPHGARCRISRNRLAQQVFDPLGHDL